MAQNETEAMEVDENTKVDNNEPEEDLHSSTYIPRDVALKKYVLDPPEIPDITKEVEEKLKGLEDAIATGSLTEAISLAPKKSNWDLKRDLEPRMRTLQRRTDKAILKLRKLSLSDPKPKAESLIDKINERTIEDYSAQVDENNDAE